jgi:hypothetical protein
VQQQDFVEEGALEILPDSVLEVGKQENDIERRYERAASALTSPGYVR